MGQPFLKPGYYKMHFYFKCIILIMLLNYFHVQKKKKDTSAEKRIKESSLFIEKFQSNMVNSKRLELGVLGICSIHYNF